jgi:N-acetylglucosaminyldiphosphoundecaprenol N-acetyl-beta-D-mannosaminyltransferase
MKDLLGVEVRPRTLKQILEEINTHLDKEMFIHIVSLNPEILVFAQKDNHFRSILNNAEVKLVDGVGVSLAARLLNLSVGERVTGADLMKLLIETADKKHLHVLILGSDKDTASKLAGTLQQEHPHAFFKGLMGYNDVSKPSSKEERHIQSVLKEFRPDLIFVAYGSPAQDYWIDDHKQFLKQTVCMSVGGAVDFLSGKVPRAPVFLRKVGLEWLFRLIVQPWRWKRQLKLLSFIKLVLKQKYSA